MRRLLGLWLPVATVAAAIFAFSHISRPPRPSSAPDWLLHGAEFGVLGFFLLRALAGGLRRRPRGAHVALALAVAILFGVSDEAHQWFVPERQADPRDVAADGVGAAAGIVLAMAGSRLAPTAPGRNVGAQTPLQVRLVTGPDCSLCGEARRIVHRLARRFPVDIEEVSIATDPLLESQYRLEIPVILLDGRRVSKGRVEEQRLTASFAARMKGRQV